MGIYLAPLYLEYCFYQLKFYKFLLHSAVPKQEYFLPYSTVAEDDSLFIR